MPTSKTRINISLTDELGEALTRLSRRDQVPRATKAAYLLEKALELEEDEIWDKLARAREKTGRRYIPHDRAWR
jgi:hypothetical protein